MSASRSCIVPTDDIERAALRLLAAQLCDAGQGIHPAPPRPRLVRDDRDDPGDAAAAVRLCHQHHAASSADGGVDAGGQRSRALDPEGDGEYRLFPLHPRSAQRRRVRRSPAVGQGPVRRGNPARLRARGAARRSIRRCWSRPMRPIRWRQARRSARSARSCRPRWHTISMSAIRPRCRSRSAPTPATTRRPRRGSTSCPASSAPS